MEPEYCQQKRDFEKVFSNVPLNERRMPIYVHQEFGPMSWLVLKLEVDFDTEIAIKALKFLKETKII